MTSSIPPATSPTNRLSIAHLFLWTAASALAVAAIMPDPFPVPRAASISAESRARVDHNLYVWRVATAIAGPILGAGLAAVGIATWRGIRGRTTFPTLPGHWLLMIVGSCAVAAILIRLQFWPGCILPFSMLLVAMSQVQQPERWKRVFSVAFLSAASFSVLGCCCIPLGSSPLAAVILPAILLASPIGVIVAAVRDVQLGVGQDLFHWCGVVAFPALVLVLLVAVVVS